MRLKKDFQKNNKHLLSEIMQADDKDGIYEAFDCKYIKRLGESCTLNNKCRFPECGNNFELKKLKSSLEEMQNRKKPDELLCKHWQREIKLLESKIEKNERIIVS